MKINGYKAALYADIVRAAATHEKSLNRWVTDTLDQATQNG